VEKQRFTESDDELDPLAGVEPLRIDAAKALASVGEVVGSGAVAEPFEIGACGNQVGAIALVRREPCALRRSHRSVELALVVEKTRLRKGVFGISRVSAAEREQKADHRQGGATHAPMVAQGSRRPILLTRIRLVIEVY